MFIRKLIASLILVLFASPVFAASYTVIINGTNLTTPPAQNNWYVSNAGSGTGSGADQDDSWSLSSMNWTQIKPGDSVYLCGTVRGSLSIPKSGIPGYPIYIRGDCPGNAGVLNISNIQTGPWTSAGSGVYSMPYVWTSLGSAGMVVEDDAALIKFNWNTNAATTIASMVGAYQYISSSSTSNTIGTGSLTFTVLTGLTIPTGNAIKIQYSGNQNDYVIGTVTSYNSGTGSLVINAASVGGSGTFTSWYVYVNGGAWAYDSTNHILYVLDYALDSPSGHTMEVGLGGQYSTAIVGTNVSYITIENLTIKNASDYGIDFNSGLIQTGWVINGSGNNVINNCHIYNIGNWGVFTGGQTNVTVSNNNIDHACWIGHITQAIGEVVRMDGVGGSVFNNTISYSPSIGLNLYHVTGTLEYNNVIHDNWGETTQFAGGLYFDRASYCIVYNNMIYNWIDGININDEDGVAPSYRNQIYNNIVYNSYQQGMFLGAGSGWVTSQENMIYNNTIYQGNSPNTVVLLVGGSTNDYVKNNIFYGTIQFTRSTYETFVSGRWDYNNTYGNYSDVVNGYAFLTFAQWQAYVSGETNASNPSGGSAHFVSASTAPYDYHLSSGSASILAGKNLSSVFTTDYSGTGRQSTGAWDVGAYKY